MSTGEPFDVIGKPRRRVDGRAKVTGQTRFADDIVLPRMLHMRLLRSPHPHARIVAIDTARAQQHPGVHLVLTGRDFPVTFGILPVSQDEYPLAPERVRYVGDPLAAVVARDEQAAGEALDLIDVTWEVLPTIALAGGGAGATRRAHPRLQRPRQHPPQPGLRVRRRRRGAGRVRPRVRGPVLLRGQHPPADRAARGGGRGRRRGQAHAVVVHAGPALRAPADGARAADARVAHPRRRLPQRRRLRRQDRHLQPRGRGAEGRADAGPPGEDLPQPRGSLLHAPRPPPGADEVPHRRHPRRPHHRHAPVRRCSTAAATGRTARPAPSTPAR